MTTVEKFQQLGLGQFIELNAEDLLFVCKDSNAHLIESARVYSVKDNARLQVLEVVFEAGNHPVFGGQTFAFTVVDREMDDYAKMKRFEGRLELIYDSAAQ